MVKQYKKKPVTIEAIQCTGSNFDEIKEFCGDKLIPVPRVDSCTCTDYVGYCIDTLEGCSYMLSEGDFVIKGIKGEFYPCKPDVFEQTYIDPTSTHCPTCFSNSLIVHYNDCYETIYLECKECKTM